MRENGSSGVWEQQRLRTDQPAHLSILLSAFVIPFLESFISKFAPGEIRIFQLVSVVEDTCLSLALSETPYIALRPICCWYSKEPPQ